MSEILNVVEIKRFAVHDGPGIRTTLFLKGCPLHCMWCHNPEGISVARQMAIYGKKCIRCMECIRVCKSGAHVFEDAEHVWRAQKCTGCGVCEKACLGDALQLYGRHMTVDEACAALLEDSAFYTGGGVTLSGGEPLLQYAAGAKLLRKIKTAGVHTAVDTSGDVDWAAFEEVIPHTDLFLFDIKQMDDTRHTHLTGHSNAQILENLARLAKSGSRIEIRMPIIPGMNDSDADIIAAGTFLDKIKPEKVVLLPYHSLAGSKYEALGMRYMMPEDVISPDRDAMERIERTLSQFSLIVECPTFS